jgi:hypothetical protein
VLPFWMGLVRWKIARVRISPASLKRRWGKEIFLQSKSFLLNWGVIVARIRRKKVNNWSHQNWWLQYYAHFCLYHYRSDCLFTDLCCIST